MKLEFSLVLKEVPVTLQTKSGEQNVFLRELSGKSRDEYLSLLGKKMRYDSDGKPSGLKSFDGLHVALVALCLFDERSKAIPSSVIEQYPASVVEALFDAAQDLSKVTEATAVELGND